MIRKMKHEPALHISVCVCVCVCAYVEMKISTHHFLKLYPLCGLELMLLCAASYSCRTSTETTRLSFFSLAAQRDFLFVGYRAPYKVNI